MVLGLGIPLLSGLAVPLQCLRIILGHAFAIGIHEAEVVLGPGKPLFSCKGEPLDGSLVILGDTTPMIIYHA